MCSLLYWLVIATDLSDGSLWIRDCSTRCAWWSHQSGPSIMSLKVRTANFAKCGKYFESVALLLDYHIGIKTKF
jgi:hypothetical protein